MLNVVQTTCKLCNTRTSENILADKLIRDLPENVIFGGKLKIVECQSCGLRYLNPMPALQDISAIYDFDVYNDSTNSNTFLQEYFYGLIGNRNIKLKKVLEVGCGTGEFLAYLESKNISVAGVEFAESSQRVKFKGDLYIGRMEDISISKNQFDVIFMLNVIEHLIDPLKVLTKINGLLKNDGVLILRHPNSDLFFNTVYKYMVEIPKYILHQTKRRFRIKTMFTIVGFQNQHLFYFNYRTIKMMLCRSGFDIEFFFTEDPFNKYRFKMAVKERRFSEAFIAFIRHVMSYFGLGNECIIVARLNHRLCSSYRNEIN